MISEHFFLRKVGGLHAVMRSCHLSIVFSIPATGSWSPMMVRLSQTLEMLPTGNRSLEYT